MPVKIPDRLPAKEILKSENLCVIDEGASFLKDIPVLKIAILNLMPTKIVTETQLLRLLCNTPLQLEVTLLQTESYACKNTPKEHLALFYKTFRQVRNQKFDGFIITGAPIEHLEFEDVDYWEELTEILDWSKSSVKSSLHICWGAQAGLYYYYGIPKYPLSEKKFGVFPHKASIKNHRLLLGFDDIFYVPHSRHTEVRREDIERISDLLILSESDESGLYIAASKDGSKVFVTGHSEYDPYTLKSEYDRDISKGLSISAPKNYFPEDDASKEPIVRWRGHSNLLFSNWLNYYVHK